MHYCRCGVVLGALLVSWVNLTRVSEFSASELNGLFLSHFVVNRHRTLFFNLCLLVLHKDLIAGKVCTTLLRKWKKSLFSDRQPLLLIGPRKKKRVHAAYHQNQQRLYFHAMCESYIDTPSSPRYERRGEAPFLGLLAPLALP